MLDRIILPDSVARLAVLLWFVPSTVYAQTVLVPGFNIEAVATGLPSTIAGVAVAPQGFGSLGGDVFIADPGSVGTPDDGQILLVDSSSGSVSQFIELDGDPLFPRFGPGGAFGGELYVSANEDPQNPLEGIVYRVDSGGGVTTFGSQTPPSGTDYIRGGAGIAFGAGLFGTFLYTGCSAGDISDCISRLPSSGGTAALFHDFGSPLVGSPRSMDFGDLGAGTRLVFGISVTSGGTNVESGIYALDSSGARSSIATLSSSPHITGAVNGIAFGAGGAFGSFLYATDASGTILKIDGVASTTQIVSGLTNPWGLAIAGDDSALYVTDAGTGTLYRLVPVSPVPALLAPGLAALVATMAFAAAVRAIRTRRAE